jgi:hypothetical protein
MYSLFLYDIYSGNSADISSNGNSNGSGSAASSGSADYFATKDDVESQQIASSSEKHSNKSVHEMNTRQPSSPSYYDSNDPNSADSSWDYRCSQMMKGIIPVEFSEYNPSQSTNNALQFSNEESFENTNEGARKRRSPRFAESSQSSGSEK